MSLKPPQPLQPLLRADEILPTVRRLLAEESAARDEVAKTIALPSARFHNAVAPIQRAEDRTQGETGVIGMLRYSGPADRDTREAVEEAQGLWAAAAAERHERADVYEVLAAAREYYHSRRDGAGAGAGAGAGDGFEGRGHEELDEESRRVLENLWLEFRRAGHGVLDAEQIQTYLARRERIEELKREFRRNLSGEVGGVWFGEDELQGVPAQEMERWKTAAEGSAEEGEIESSGRRRRRTFVPLERANCEAVLRHAVDAETRRRMWVAYEGRAAANAPVYKEMLVLRDENARLLGYGSHAEFRIETRTAPSAAWVERFLERLRQDLMPRGRREMEALAERKKRDRSGSKSSHQASSLDGGGGGGGNDENDAAAAGRILPWDYDYYTRLLEEEEADVDHKLLSEYFPLRHTLSAMLGLFTEFLGLEFVPIQEEDTAGKLWAPEVEVWAVWEGRGEKKGEFVGYLYADVLWREGKYRGACNVNLQCGYVKEDGTRVFPATILMCAFQPPTAVSCALLKHREVVTLFHELGHGLHDLVCRTRYTRFHGTRVTPEFGEAPSTMLENWCWMPRELARMGRHYTRVDPAYMAKWREDHGGDDAHPPPEEIPPELLEKLVASRGLNRALWFLRQLLFATFDLTVNNQKSTAALKELDEVALFNDLQDSLTLRPNPDKETRGYGHVQSTHLISLYDAGYYSYLCAQAFAADFFESNFARDPSNPEAWERYRRGILEPGGSRAEMDIMTSFLGRESGPDALLRSLGLATGEEGEQTDGWMDGWMDGSSC